MDISPDGVITFVSSLYPGCISDKVITRKSGILEQGDSVMGFDTEEDLILNITRCKTKYPLPNPTQLDQTNHIT